jgi:hypothetical protein
MLSEFSAKLQQLLADAGVTDTASLQQVLANNPALREQVEAFVKTYITTSLDRLIQNPDEQTAYEVWRAIPLELEEAFLQAAEQRVADLGETPTGQRLRGFIAAWQQMQRDRQPPLVQAIQAFVTAPDEATARRVFDERRDLLQPYEAQRLIDALAAQAPTELRPLLAARAELLRRLRGGAPEVSPVLEQTLVPAASGNLQQLNQTLISHSAYATQGGTATVYNTTNIYSLPRQWQRPSPPRLTRHYTKSS